MDYLSKDTIGVIKYLLPGFLSAWIFYGLTAHPKKQPFERVVQALIFTAVVQVFTNILRWLLIYAADTGWRVWGDWTTDVAFGWSMVLATIVGLSFAISANKDWPHKRLRDWSWTSRTSYPHEWFSALGTTERVVVLHFKNGRRLMGFPKEWPDQPDSGHFLMTQAQWLDDNNKRIALPMVYRFIVPVKMIEMVEQLMNPGELDSKNAVEHIENQIVSIEQRLQILERSAPESGKT